MTAPAVIPPVTITVGLQFSQSFRLEDPTAETPILSLTGYSVTYSISEKPFATPFKTGTAEITETDRFIITLTKAETALFSDYALPIIGGRPSALLQIDLTGPTDDASLVLQGPVIIAGTL